MVGGGFQSFVAWRYLMERRPPLHVVVMWFLLGAQVLGAFGLGVAEGLVAGNIVWKPHPDSPFLALGIRDGIYASAGLGYLAAAAIAVAATWRHGVPWIASVIAVVLGIGLGAAVPASTDVGLPFPTMVALIAGLLPLVVLLLFAILGSRPIGALVLGFLLAGAIATAVGYGLEWWWKTHEAGRPPYNKLVKSMSNLHAYDAMGARIMMAAGSALAAIGTLIATLRRRRRSAGRGMFGWAIAIAGFLVGAGGAALLYITFDQTAAEWAKWFGIVFLAPLVLLVPLGVFRYFFTFFTTVSMSGVFVGSMALVIVLSVMSGFESDLRTKILGSNAHIRVTRDSGMIADWREVMERIEKVPGVEGVTPYATTEVVLSANSNYATVVIKGIDPSTVIHVTELFDDIEGKTEEDRQRAVRNLYPLEDDPFDVTHEVDDDGDGDVVDQAPDDLTGGGEPIDFSGDNDPAPDDFVTGDEEEPDAIDYSDDGEAEEEEEEDEDVADGSIELEDLIEGDPFEDLDDELDDEDWADASPEGGRLALLDGVLVGKELVKQLHLFTGQEVRLVSPLADPANPDATGTPIPFHRDYRIAGIFYTGMYEYDLKFVYVPLESLQDFIQIGDEIDGIEVRVANPEATEGVRAAIARELGPDYVVQDWKELNRNLFTALKLEKIAMFLVLAIIILVASFSIIGNLIMVVVEKGKEIALIKTLGASDFGVMFVFVMQGFFIGLVGTIAGVIEGLLVCVACKIFGFPINADVYYISTLPIDIDALSVAAIGAAGLVISAVATLYPAWMAARLRPAEGLRHD